MTSNLYQKTNPGCQCANGVQKQITAVQTRVERWPKKKIENQKKTQENKRLIIASCQTRHIRSAAGQAGE